MQTITTLQTRAKRLELIARKQLSPLLAGGERASMRGQGLEFSGLRPYQPGDDPRFLDWNVTARQQIPHVREYREERSRSLLLLVDCSRSMNRAKRDLQAETGALLVFAAIANRDRVGLITFSDKVQELFPLGSGDNHARHLAKQLLTLRASGLATNLTPPLEAAQQILQRPGMIVILSDFHADPPVRLLRRTANRHDLLAVVVRDTISRQKYDSGIVALQDAESGEVSLVDLGYCSGLGWRNDWEDDARQLSLDLASSGIDSIELHSGTPPLAGLLRLFQRRKPR